MAKPAPGRNQGHRLHRGSGEPGGSRNDLRRCVQPGRRRQRVEMGIFAWSTLWVYLLAQIIGGIAAGVAFVYVCTQGISAASVVPWWSWLAM
jgi:hypothetical protein